MNRKKCEKTALLEEYRKGTEKIMKKKILSIVLALSMALPSVSVVYGSEFSSVQEENAGSVQMENATVFFDGDAAVEEEVPESDGNMVNENQEMGAFSNDADVFPDESGEETELPNVQQPEELFPEEDQQGSGDADIFIDEPKDSIDEEPEIEDIDIFTASEETEPEILSAENFQYKLSGVEITIVGYLGNDEIVEIPEKIGEYAVTGIGEKAFSGSSIKEVKLPKGLKYIGTEAFSGCAVLTKVELPAEVEVIGENAFAACPQLVLYCYPETYGQKYASEENLPYKLVEMEAEKINISSCTISVTSSKTCTGKELSPTVKVKKGNQVLVRDQDYTVEYRDNIKPGTGIAVITGIGAYEGNAEKTFKITLAAPKMSSAASASYKSIKVTWKAVPGAESYTIYYKGDTIKSWKKLKSGIKGTSYVHTASTSKPLVTGKKYTYTVKASGNGVTSSYDKTGKSAKPTLDTVKLGKVQSAAYNKLKITWSKVAGASGYYIYRKSGSSWKKVATTTGTSYTHKSSSKFPITTGTTYTYTVKAYRKTGSTVATGGYNKTGIKGKAVPDKPVLISAECTAEGKITIRWKKAAGATNYIIYRKNAKGKWEQIKNIKGANMIGYTHVTSEKFPIVTGNTYTYTVRSYTTTGNTKGLYDKNGKKVKAETAIAVESAATLERAKQIVASITNPGMSSSQKLKACFDWVISKPYMTWRKFENTPGWPALYANDHFIRGRGNCHADASAFAYLAKALGYTNVYVCTDADGTTWDTPHSWTEINGLVYDPLFAEAKNYYRYYGVSYRTYELSAVLHIAI